jgi:hypothetical protein
MDLTERLHWIVRFHLANSGSQTQAAIREAAKMLDEIDARHYRDIFTDTCRCCLDDWPCADHLTLHPEPFTQRNACGDVMFRAEDR